MRRKIIILVALLLAGTLIGLTTAVLAAAYAPLSHIGTIDYFKSSPHIGQPPPDALRSIAPDEWIDCEPPKQGFYRLFHIRSAGAGLTTDAVVTDWQVPGATSILLGNRMGLRVQSGWPVPCLQCTGIVEPLSASRHRMPRVPVQWQGHASETSETMQITLMFDTLTFDRPIPALIMPIGLAINSTLFAALVGIPSWVLLFLRRYRRMLRGLCPLCKYPSAGLPACPECGWDNPLSAPE